MEKKGFLVFPGFRLDLDNRELLRDIGGTGEESNPVPLGRKDFDVLLFLVERQVLVTTRELLDHFWPEAADSNLRHCIKKLRAALGDSRYKPRYIKTVRGQGYRFLETVSLEPASHGNGSVQTPGRVVTRQTELKVGLLHSLRGPLAVTESGSILIPGSPEDFKTDPHSPDAGFCDQWQDVLKRILEREVIRELENMRPADADTIKAALQSFNKDPVCRKHIGIVKFPPFLEHWYRKFTLAVLDRSQERCIDSGVDGHPLEVAFPATLPGAAAMFFYLSKVRKLQLNLTCNEIHTVSIVERIREFKFEPDLIVGGEGMMAELQRGTLKKRYSLLAVLNKSYIHVVAPKMVSGINAQLFKAKFMVPADYINSLSIGLKRLQAERLAGKDVDKREPSQLLHVLAKQLAANTAEIYGITYSLQARTAQILEMGSLIRLPGESGGSYQTFVVAADSIIRRRDLATAMAAALATAWQNLRTDSSLREKVIRIMTEDSYFLEATKAAAGWHTR